MRGQRSTLPFTLGMAINVQWVWGVVGRIGLTRCPVKYKVGRNMHKLCTNFLRCFGKPAHRDCIYQLRFVRFTFRFVDLRIRGSVNDNFGGYSRQVARHSAAIGDIKHVARRRHYFQFCRGGSLQGAPDLTTSSQN